MKRVCFKCSKSIRGDHNDGGPEYPPLDAVVFQAFGNYGSSVFDPMDSTFLELFICDKCLKAGRTKLLRLNRVVVPKLEFVDGDVFAHSLLKCVLPEDPNNEDRTLLGKPLASIRARTVVKP